jgi:hypothetical protein
LSAATARRAADTSTVSAIAAVSNRLEHTFMNSAPKKTTCAE